MRIGNGPRLAIPRPGVSRRRGWYGRWLDRGQAYDEWRALRRSELRAMRRPHVTGDAKPRVTRLASLNPGECYRLVDDHGRAHGARLTKRDSDSKWTRVRRVDRQEEDLHSLLSRMLKRAHKSGD